MIQHDEEGNFLFKGYRFVNYGLQHSLAHRLAFVTFDDHPSVGQSIWVAYMGIVKAAIKQMHQAGVDPVMGSREGSSEPNTGLGYKISPAALQAIRYPLYPLTSNRRELGARGRDIVKQWLERGPMHIVRIAEKHEEKKGIDLFHHLGPSLTTYETKARGEEKKFCDLFIQIGERNTDRRYD